MSDSIKSPMNAIHHVDVYAVMPDGTRRLSFSGRVESAFYRHPNVNQDYDWSIEDFVMRLSSEAEIVVPYIAPDPLPGAFMPRPQMYTAVARFVDTYEVVSWL